jgi:hypothetical protein
MEYAEFESWEIDLTNLLSHKIQEVIDDSWKKIQSTSIFADIQEYHQYLYNGHFYEIRDSGKIPNSIFIPSHWFVSSLLLEPVLKVAFENGYCFKYNLPGKPDATHFSFEIEKHDRLYRIIGNYLIDKKGNETPCWFQFQHTHEDFFFSEPPSFLIKKNS